MLKFYTQKKNQKNSVYKSLFKCNTANLYF